MLYYIESTKNIPADSFSRLQRLIYPSQLIEGNKPIEPVAVSDDEDEYDT